MKQGQAAYIGQEGALDKPRLFHHNAAYGTCLFNIHMVMPCRSRSLARMCTPLTITKGV